VQNRRLTVASVKRKIMSRASIWLPVPN